MNRRGVLAGLSALPFMGLFAAKVNTELKPLGVDIVYKEYVGKNVWYPYARKGEIVTCTNNHPICEFMEDVGLGENQNVDLQLGNWRQPPPMLGTPVPRCSICNAKFYVSGLYHVGKEWRDPLGNINRYAVLRDIVEKDL